MMRVQAFTACVAIILMATGCVSLRDLPEVNATAETVPVPSPEDAADDPAIWLHASDPDKSRILGTNKQQGLHVYDLEGNERQFLEVGLVNNIDVRQNVSWGNERIDIAAGSNRTDQTISLFTIDENGDVRFFEGQSIATGLAEPYGICLYHENQTGDLFVFVNDKDGRYKQFQLNPSEDVGVSSQVVREFSVSTQPEGCVADDKTGIIYIGEENHGIWKADASPDAPFEPELIDVTSGPWLVADVEGLALYHGKDRTLLFASSQGDNSFAVYETGDSDIYLGAFRVGDDPESGIDGASETDGIAVSAALITSDYPKGLLVVQDGENTPDAPGESTNQNFKLVSIEQVFEALKNQPTAP